MRMLVKILSYHGKKLVFHSCLSTPLCVPLFSNSALMFVLEIESFFCKNQLATFHPHLYELAIMQLLLHLGLCLALDL